MCELYSNMMFGAENWAAALDGEHLVVHRGPLIAELNATAQHKGPVHSC